MAGTTANCDSCENMLTCPYDSLGRHCLGTKEEVEANGGKYLYRDYKRGDYRRKLLEKQRSGELNIVIGGQGEHEVNSKWLMSQAYKHLANTCENCGGLVYHEGEIKLILEKPYGGIFVLDWMDGALYQIAIREHRVVWMDRE